jgi:hypothetical protein
MPIIVEDEEMSTKSVEEEPFYDLIACLDSMGGEGEVGEGITLYPSGPDHTSTGIAVVSAVDTGSNLPGSKVEMSSAGSKRKAESTTTATAAKFTRYDIERLFEESDDDGDDDDDFEDCEISENRVRNVLQRQPTSTLAPVVSKRPTTVVSARSPAAAVVALQARVRSVILASSASSSPSSSTSEESDARNNIGRPETGSCNKIAAAMTSSSVPAGPAFVHAVRSLLLSSTSESEGSESRDGGSESRDRESAASDRGVIIGRGVSEEDLADSYLCTECRPCRLLQGALGTF